MRFWTRLFIKKIKPSSGKEATLYNINCTKLCIQAFTPCHRKLSQSQYRRTVVYSTLLHPNFPSRAARRSHWLRWPLYFLCRAWYKIVIQRLLVLFHRISHLPLVLSWYLPLGFSWYTKITSDSLCIPWYTNQIRYITSVCPLLLQNYNSYVLCSHKIKFTRW